MRRAWVMDSTARRRIPVLALTALGVVYGDIGTSPLYAIRECFYGRYSVSPTPANVLGVLSLVTWSLLLVISVKYGIFVLRADDRGEGGIFALGHLVSRTASRRGHAGSKWFLGLAVFGAALLYGDGMITPAISVLSAVEGLEIATPVLTPYVVPITIAILVGLFLVQRWGTGGVGKLFGPAMLVWFGLLAVTGVSGIVDAPEVLAAISPVHAVRFFATHGLHAVTILGVVFLVVTGGEALFLDIGHFGKLPVRIGWYGLVLPCLLLNYFGQGALVMTRGAAISSPFYELAPSWLLYPTVALATLATVIASQAIISGAFSVTYQASRAGFLPRVHVRHTSESERGQVYVPVTNWMLLLATTGLVLVFGRSGDLAAAYGVAIATTMLITTVLFYFAMRWVLEWPLPVAIGLTALFGALDLTFLAANLGKFLDGAWLPLAVAAVVFTIMTTWKKGRAVERRKSANRRASVPEVLAELGGGGAYRRVPGQAVYLARNPEGTPRTLIRNLEHNRALHRRVVIYTAQPVPRARVPEDERLEVEQLRDDDIHRVTARYGFLEQPDVPRDLADAELDLDLDEVTYFLGDEAHVPDRELSMNRVRAKVYAFLANVQKRATRQFGLPPQQVMHIGAEIEL